MTAATSFWNLSLTRNGLWESGTFTSTITATSIGVLLSHLDSLKMKRRRYSDHGQNVFP
ncbi:hypothetical protein BV22DRAFT_1039315 [Leucogyrophana mollusca]|uniref:Uncharacterized protein n=1 Tax=Leucogyrophana mollusca TaxID=85980 RepID=A0ACB8B644_9AGAM|nr:hypothetical protein BV22DRAFT_1039315 [Leucogyrophana mollusca]